MNQLNMNKEDRMRTIAEELKMCMGFDVDVYRDRFEWKLKMDTIAGVYIYSPSEKTIMGDVYRFISNYGLKIHKWGLESKISEYQNIVKN